MDTPSCSKTTSQNSPPRSRKLLSLGHLSLSEKQCIINMYKQRLNKKPNAKTVDIVATICEATGVAKSTVYRVIGDFKQTGTTSSPKNIGGRPSILKDFDERIKNAIRRIIHEFFFKNEIPTLNKILLTIKQRSDLPQMSRSTLHKLMKQINFKFLKRSRKSILIERDDIIRWRRSFLRAIKRYRNEGRPIFYLDETWVNEGHTKAKVWVDESIKTKRQAFNEGLSTGLKRPSGKGRRLIIVHAGSNRGFVENALLVFEGKKSGDYHEEMNATVFEVWFSELLKRIPVGSVIVMDNAPYHSRKVHKIPSSVSKKLDMQEWLLSKDIPFEENMVRSELLHIIRQHKEKFDLYVVDEMAKTENKIVLRLPPYHCELNPIEMVWAQVKNEVAATNTTFVLNDVKNLLLRALNNVTEEHWRNCIKHVLDEEEKMAALDGIVDKLIEPLIINITGNSDDSDSSENTDLV